MITLFVSLELLITNESCPLSPGTNWRYLLQAICAMQSMLQRIQKESGLKEDKSPVAKIPVQGYKDAFHNIKR